MPERPQNSFLLLLLLTTSVARMVPFAFVYYAFPVVRIIGAVILTFVVVISLILFTSWAEKRGHYLDFLAPLLLAFGAVIIVVNLIQLFFPEWRTSMPSCNEFRALLCCGYIVYSSSYLMQHSRSSRMVISLFFSIVGLFLSFVNMTFGFA